MTGYLQDGETYESRLLDLMTEVRRAPQDELRTRRFQEVMALTAVMQATGPNVFHGDERGLDPQDDIDEGTVDYLVGVLDASYGGEAPAAIRANFLYHLTGEGTEVEVTGAEFQVQADDPDDKLPWAQEGAAAEETDSGYIKADELGVVDTTQQRAQGSTLDAYMASPKDDLSLPVPDGMEDRLPDDEEPEPISAAERLRQKTKKKGK